MKHVGEALGVAIIILTMWLFMPEGCKEGNPSKADKLFEMAVGEENDDEKMDKVDEGSAETGETRSAQGAK